MNFKQMKQIDYDSLLNEEQKEAVNSIEGPLLIIAGAGSGKTRTIVFRLARLIEIGIPPDGILLLTFTRKAAWEMLRRSSKLVGDSCGRIYGGTFHSFCYMQLKIYGELLGYPPNFTVLDRQDIEDILNLIAKENGLKGARGKPAPKKATLASIYSKRVNCEKDTETIILQEYPHFVDIIPTFDEIFRQYTIYKKEQGLMDYDDLLINWQKLLENYPDVRERVSNRFQYIMVDEYQDTNPAQAQIIRLMAYTHDNVMAVGDDSQSIYSFRGADFRNILLFPEIFPGTKVIRLIRNYRTHQPNLDCTNAIIANAKEKFEKRLIAVREGGVRPVVLKAIDEEEQALLVASKIKEFIDEGIPPCEIAVLFRASFHSFHLEGQLARIGIQYIKRGGLKLFEGAHIKDFLSFVRILTNPLDRISLIRVLTLIPGLGQKGVERLYEAMIKGLSSMQKSQVSSDSSASQPESLPHGSSSQALSHQELPPYLLLSSIIKFKSRARWKAEVDKMISDLIEISENQYANNNISGVEKPIDNVRLLNAILKIYKPYLETRYFDDYPKRMEELYTLIEIARQFQTIEDFLAEIVLEPLEDGQNIDTDKIILSTVHSAKGLEWKIVFILSLADGRFPSQLAINNNDIEEERRLFYVASTRAKDRLFFACPLFINISGGRTIHSPVSRFLEEIPEGLIEIVEPRHNRDANRERESKNYDNGIEDGQYRVGMTVRHNIFGKGIISSVFKDNKIRVIFDGFGEKTLNTNIAKLTIMS